MPSITSWTRLEPRCRDVGMQEAVRARLYDPLWLLARQWQVGEFEGEDAGSPVLARWRGHSAPITRVHAGVAEPGKPVRPVPYNAATLPLEVAIERQRVRAGPVFDGASSLRLAAESGLHFLRLLDAQQTSRSYRSDFIRRYALEAPLAGERAALDAETLDYWDLMAGRVPDGRLLDASLRAGDGRRLPVPTDLEIAPQDDAEINAAVDAWVAYYDNLFSEPADAGDSWQRDRMEYAFSLGAGLPDGDTTLSASEYHGGHLDWHSVDVDPAVQLGATFDHAGIELVRSVIPAPVSFRGAPAQRFWEFEDARIDYGLLPAGPGDLPQLLLSDFATQYGNDWYVIPIDLAVGTLTRTRSLVVADTFGVQTLLRPLNQDTPSAFSMYSLSRLQRPAALASAAATLAPVANLLFLAPSLLRSLDSTPRDELHFLRDEMANMAWAVEHVMQGRVEQRIDLAAASQRDLQAADAPGAGVPVYRLATDVPNNWVPLLPQRMADGSEALRLVRAAMLAADGSNEMRPARGPLLGGAPLALFDEEVPREGMRVTRSYQCTRWIGGGTLLWLSQRKQIGRGEGSSGLRYDGLDA